MRYAECLVKVQVAHVCADESRVGETHLCVQIRPIHIDLTTMFMDNITNLFDLGFEDSECAGVCHHDCRKLILMLFALFLQVLDIEIACLRIAFERNHFHTSHSSTCGICPMCRDRYEADVPNPSIRLTIKVLLDNTETGKLALSARIRLETD